MKEVTWLPALLTVNFVKPKQFADESLIEFNEITGSVRKVLMDPFYIIDPLQVRGKATKLKKGVGFQFGTGLVIIAHDDAVKFL